MCSVTPDFTINKGGHSCCHRSNERLVLAISGNVVVAHSPRPLPDALLLGSKIRDGHSIGLASIAMDHQKLFLSPSDSRNISPCDPRRRSTWPPEAPGANRAKAKVHFTPLPN